MKPKANDNRRSSGRKLAVSTGGVDEFINRSLDRARKLDRGERLKLELHMTFEDPADLVRVLTTQRIRLLETLRQQPGPVAGLATSLKRDRKSVGRDIKVLESLGLLRTEKKPNPGHGQITVVSPVAAKYRLTATI
jgi:predicted transcriptional regulator